MRRDLANARMGQLVAPDCRTYSLCAPRIEPAEIEALIEAGCPVVTYFPADGCLARRGRRLARMGRCPDGVGVP